MNQTSSANPAFSSAGETRRSKGWSGWPYVAGIAFIVVGVLAFFKPTATGLVAGIYLGSMLTVGGAFALVGGLANIRHRGAWVTALLGLMSAAIGVWMLYNPVAGAVSLVWSLGVWLILGGIFELAMAFSVRLGRGWLLLIGGADLVLGFLVLWMDPAQAFYFLAFFVGASFIYRGIWSLVFAAELSD